MRTLKKGFNLRKRCIDFIQSIQSNVFCWFKYKVLSEKLYWSGVLISWIVGIVSFFPLFSSISEKEANIFYLIFYSLMCSLTAGVVTFLILMFFYFVVKAIIKMLVNIFTN